MLSPRRGPCADDGSGKRKKTPCAASWTRQPVVSGAPLLHSGGWGGHGHGGPAAVVDVQGRTAARSRWDGCTGSSKNPAEGCSRSGRGWASLPPCRPPPGASHEAVHSYGTCVTRPHRVRPEQQGRSCPRRIGRSASRTAGAPVVAARGSAALARAATDATNRYTSEPIRAQAAWQTCRLTDTVRAATPRAQGHSPAPPTAAGSSAPHHARAILIGTANRPPGPSSWLTSTAARAPRSSPPPYAAEPGRLLSSCMPVTT